MSKDSHSEPAREAVALSLLRELHAVVVVGECPSLLNEDSGGNADLAMRIEAALSASPAPAASGGLKAVREAMETSGPYEPRICKDMPAGCCGYGVVSLREGREVCRVWREQDARAIADALAAPVATGGEPYAWVRRWAYDGVDVMAMKKADRPAGWHLLDVTKHKLLHDDVALYTHPAPSETGASLGVKEAIADWNEAEAKRWEAELWERRSWGGPTIGAEECQAAIKLHKDAATRIRAVLEGRSDG